MILRFWECSAGPAPLFCPRPSGQTTPPEQQPRPLIPPPTATPRFPRPAPVARGRSPPVTRQDAELSRVPASLGRVPALRSALGCSGLREREGDAGGRGRLRAGSARVPVERRWGCRHGAGIQLRGPRRRRRGFPRARGEAAAAGPAGTGREGGWEGREGRRALGRVGRGPAVSSRPWWLDRPGSHLLAPSRSCHAGRGGAAATWPDLSAQQHRGGCGAALGELEVV